ncbi:hypothetical protein MNV49_004247 [Pseudohyphozyma bogoriensis]|nr:hypothetical protein MNV49_004247 [Pseudohyphozyma bogoriensis]
MSGKNFDALPLLAFTNNLSCPSIHVAGFVDDLPELATTALATSTTIKADELCGIRLFLYAVFFSVVFTTIAIGYVETVYRGTRYFYFQGKMKRYYPLTSDRQLLRNFLGAGSFISPTVFTYFYVFPDPVYYDFRPLEILFYSAMYMLSHDQWFYHIHVHSHTDKFMYESLHKLHHEYTHSMNVFMTAYGTLAENLIDVGFGWMFYIAILHYAPSTFNFWNLVFPLSFATLTTILGHAGYATSPHFALFHPLMICTKPIAKHMLTPNDHQAHHLLRRCNYGLFFRWK